MKTLTFQIAILLCIAVCILADLTERPIRRGKGRPTTKPKRLRKPINMNDADDDSSGDVTIIGSTIVHISQPSERRPNTPRKGSGNRNSTRLNAARIVTMGNASYISDNPTGNLDPTVPLGNTEVPSGLPENPINSYNPISYSGNSGYQNPSVPNSGYPVSAPEIIQTSSSGSQIHAYSNPVYPQGNSENPNQSSGYSISSSGNPVVSYGNSGNSVTSYEDPLPSSGNPTASSGYYISSSPHQVGSYEENSPVAPSLSANPSTSYGYANVPYANRPPTPPVHGIHPIASQGNVIPSSPGYSISHGNNSPLNSVNINPSYGNPNPSSSSVNPVISHGNSIPYSGNPSPSISSAGNPVNSYGNPITSNIDSSSGNQNNSPLNPVISYGNTNPSYGNNAIPSPNSPVYTSPVNPIPSSGNYYSSSGNPTHPFANEASFSRNPDVAVENIVNKVTTNSNSNSDVLLEVVNKPAMKVIETTKSNFIKLKESDHGIPNTSSINKGDNKAPESIGYNPGNDYYIPEKYNNQPQIDNLPGNYKPGFGRNQVRHNFGRHGHNYPRFGHDYGNDWRHEGFGPYHDHGFGYGPPDSDYGYGIPRPGPSFGW